MKYMDVQMSRAQDAQERRNHSGSFFTILSFESDFIELGK